MSQTASLSKACVSCRQKSIVFHLLIINQQKGKSFRVTSQIKEGANENNLNMN